LKFRFFSNEGNEPPHVHVFRGNDRYPKVKYWLTPEPKMYYSIGFTAQEQRVTQEIIQRNHKVLIVKWKQHFRNK
jgi:hypothetical protein